MTRAQEIVKPGQTMPFTFGGLRLNGTVSLRIDNVVLLTATLNNSEERTAPRPMTGSAIELRRLGHRLPEGACPCLAS